MFQISQFVSPGVDRWQTTRLATMQRQSRAEVNAHRDLTEVLGKLEEINAPASSQAEDVPSVDEKHRRTQERQKLLRFVIPCGILVVLCVVYSLVLMAVSGSGITASNEFHDFQERIKQLHTTESTILDEYNQRLTNGILGLSNYVMKEAYLKTDDAIDAVLTTKKLAEWRLISRIQDWRSEHVEHVHFLTEETGFYLSFLVDLSSLVLTDVASLSDVIKWKSFYEYRRLSNQLLRFALLLRLFSNTGTNKKDVCLKSTSFFAADEQLFIRLLEPLHFSANPFYDSWKPKVRNSSLSIAFDMLAEFHQIIYGCANRTDAGWKTEVANVVRILSDQQKELFGALTIRNTNLMNECLIVFCVCFLEMFLVGLFSYFFVMLFKIETKILALVTDWCSDLQIKVDDQSLSTQSILCKIVPRSLLVASGECDVVAPYHVTETTMFMASVAYFDSLLEMFSPAQTLNILTFVLELLDERISQYNVYPVSRAGESIIVTSDNAKERQVQHACEVANMAVDIMTCCSDLEIGKFGRTKLLMKVALHSGPCSGRLVVRNGKVQLRLLGESLLVLQHIHRTASPNMIHLSEPAYRNLSTHDTYCLHYRGNIDIQGSHHRIYWLNGRRVSSVSASDGDSCYSRMGSWIELEKKPLYRLDEGEGTYEPLHVTPTRRYSQMNGDSAA